MSGKPLHGLSRTPEYRAWQTMRLRCTVPTNPAYARYGGRGIRVCERWLHSVEAFLEDMGPKPSPAHELDRRDNDGHYEPGNCRWVLRKVNDRNRRSNRLLEFGGEALPIAEWCERLGLRRDTVWKRLATGWPAEDALTIRTRIKAPNGAGTTDRRRPCAECGTIVWRTRCRSCENRRRWRARRAQEGGV